MTEPAPHRLYLHFRELPVSLRAVYTGTLLVLSVGYLFAMIYVVASHAGRDGDPMMSADDLIIAYSGSKADTRLEGAVTLGVRPEQLRFEPGSGDHTIKTCRYEGGAWRLFVDGPCGVVSIVAGPGEPPAAGIHGSLHVSGTPIAWKA